MSQTRIAFIGAGNMASALIGGLIADGTAKDSIIASDPNTDQRSHCMTATASAQSITTLKPLVMPMLSS